jgi:DNA-damage-inducible protein J
MTTALVRARVDQDVEARAATVLAGLGLTVSDAIRMLLTRIATDGALPIALAIPSAETRAAMLQAREITVGRFATANELIDDLDKNGGR